MKKRTISLVLAMLLGVGMSMPVFAADYNVDEEDPPEEIIIPIHNNTEIIEVPVTVNEIATVAAGDHTYEVELIGSGTRLTPKDVTEYVTNNSFPSESSWPTLMYAKGESTTFSGEVTVASQLELTALKLQISASVGASYTITNTQTITYKIPYGYKGCIYYSLARKYYTYRLTEKDAAGNVVRSTVNGCTGEKIDRESGYNVRLIKVKV